MGGLTTNSSIYDVMAERFNFETESWDRIMYDGFDFPFITNCTASTIIPALKDTTNIFLFGGSNTQEMTKLIQPVDTAPNKLDFRLNHLKTIN